MQDADLRALGFSNFQPWRVVVGGIEYATLEHAYQAAKTYDETEKKYIAEAATPGQAKRRGQKVQTIPRWDERKISVMATLLRAKFKPGTEWAKKLLATGAVTLVEFNNWHDTFWGRCTGDCKKGPHKPEGTNWLGVLLMERRSHLLHEASRSAK